MSESEAMPLVQYKGHGDDAALHENMDNSDDYHIDVFRIHVTTQQEDIIANTPY